MNELSELLKQSVIDWNRLREIQHKADFDLSGCNLRGANLSWANLSDADLRDADLRGANLSWADLSDADLSGCNLRGANLRDANLCDANLCDADLRGAYLSDADLSGADLRGADLCDADLRGADLSGAYGVWCLYLPGISSRGDYIYANERGNNLWFRLGCWYDTYEKTLERVIAVHGEGRYSRAVIFLYEDWKASQE